MRKQTGEAEGRAAPAAPPPADVVLLTEIRDLLASRNRHGAMEGTLDKPRRPSPGLSVYAATPAG